MNVFELLKVDHAALRLRFALIHGGSTDSGWQRAIFDEIKEALTLHAMLEEEFFYPLLEQAPETEALARSALAEHELIKRLLSELERADDSTDHWREKLSLLEAHVARHVRHEEDRLFPSARLVIGREQAEGIGLLAEEERERAILLLPQRAGTSGSLFIRAQTGLAYE